ncbi:MAG: hypothetical protein NZL90_01040 [Aquificaceae bacterium]|nr:hypothetical protein [Aquificaceae bacterium]MDW8237118.1 hypothetical protein [Aquificaceae bacterium]
MQLQDCSLLQARLSALYELSPYGELISIAKEQLKTGCDFKSPSHLRSASHIIYALEVLSHQEELSPNKHILNERFKRSYFMLSKARPYSKNHQTLYSYQFLFHKVARENLSFKDEQNALKFAMASYSLGRAILELR